MRKKIIIIAALVIAAAVMLSAGISLAAGKNGPYFRDVSIELGTETVLISDFYREGTVPGHSAFVTDVSAIDLSLPGEYPITLRYKNTRETVLLSVSDTTAPEVKFASELTVSADELPEPEDFIIEARDMSPVSVRFAQEPHIPRDYEDIEVLVIAADKYGNETSQKCTLHFSWLRSEVSLELGDTISPEDILICPERDLLLIDSEELEAINSSGEGTYTIESSTAASSDSTKINVRDTTAPELSLSDLTVRIGDEVSPESFVLYARDVSEIESIEFAGTPSTDEAGETNVQIIARDAAGNETVCSALLTVVDKNTPIFSGLSTMLVTLGRTPEYRRGVTALTGYGYACWYSVDDSQVNSGTPGTYYVTYEAHSGTDIVVRAQRKLIIVDNSEATELLVETIADSLGNDPEEISSYIRRTFSYSHEWGDDNPVWFGFTYYRGNCYVHAMCLKAIFDYKGIENQLIWVTNETHYWLIVKIDGKWKHIDPTPSASRDWTHLMNDRERLSNLYGRTWDTSLWPACE